MIRVLILYPRSEGKTLDQEYYLKQHIPLVRERLQPLKLEADIGIPVANRPPPYFAVTHMIFNSQEELMMKYFLFAAELQEDLERFTDIEIVTQVSEISR